MTRTSSMLSQARALLAAGRVGPAERAARAHLQQHPGDGEGWALLAACLQATRRHQAALDAWRRACEAAPERAEGHAGLGRLLLSAGHPRPALSALSRAVDCAPDDPDLRRLLAAALQQSGALEPAAAQLEVLARLTPDDAAPLVQAAGLRWAAGDLAGALSQAAAALSRDPDEGGAHVLLAAAQSSAGDLEAAEAHARRGAALQPDDAQAWRVLGEVLERTGQTEEARGALSQALAQQPDDPRLLWSLAACVPPLSADADDESRVRDRYRADLSRLEAAAAETLAQHPAAWCAAVRGAFALHYTGGELVEEQRRLGALVSRAVAAAHPWLKAPAPPARERLRIGVVSATFRRHTVPKLFAGWWERLDRERFEVVAYDVGLVRDAESERLAARCDRVKTLPGPLGVALRSIAEDAPDALLFPEVGMDARAMQVAAARLAPVQAVAWGHPVTTGLPTLDLFLSSAAMAPSPDRRWTTEERVDLPGLGVCYRRPGPPPPAARADFGLAEGRPLLLCVQSLFKYRPFADGLHARIAELTPEALLVFIEDKRPAVTRAFRERLSGALAHRGLAFDDHVVLLPRMSEERWMQLLSLGDLFLDSPGWSGGNTTLEALALGLPCLAFPGETMRGRHTLGMVEEMGLAAELAPATAEAWVDRAAALARDPAERARLQALVQARATRLFGDERSVRALEALLEARVAAWRASRGT